MREYIYGEHESHGQPYTPGVLKNDGDTVVSCNGTVTAYQVVGSELYGHDWWLYYYCTDQQAADACVAKIFQTAKSVSLWTDRYIDQMHGFHRKDHKRAVERFDNTAIMAILWTGTYNSPNHISIRDNDA